MQLKLSDLEIGILRKLVNGEAATVSSQQRVRLELAGMVREGANGIVATLTGRSLVREKQSDAASSGVAPEIKRDRRGRRMPFRRRTIS